MTAARINTPAIPLPRPPEAGHESDEEPTPQAIYDHAMERCAAMYQEWRSALVAIRDA